MKSLILSCTPSTIKVTVKGPDGQKCDIRAYYTYGKYMLDYDELIDTANEWGCTVKDIFVCC